MAEKDLLEGRGPMQDPAGIAQKEDPEDNEQIAVRQAREPKADPAARDLIGLMEGPGPRGRGLRVLGVDSGQGLAVRMKLLRPLK